MVLEWNYNDDNTGEEEKEIILISKCFFIWLPLIDRLANWA